eukprot:CAMPEP_0206505904 /NCGR_PEP_ID=MMETSP0324_2-20121206/56437_1 /ASSEMBLY_ACC=CAM_ASM_000836 /TAXON_ID=2866 /ORGANISM="Crypthecodinium cohnii, Strain Seligo" /LENGTH=541 /DNA_ID=CAMNT_0053995511 /DNA_START=271 /DNA_END=1895 /DNA_ORIENTATION=-
MFIEVLLLAWSTIAITVPDCYTLASLASSPLSSTCKGGIADVETQGLELIQKGSAWHTTRASLLQQPVSVDPKQHPRAPLPKLSLLGQAPEKSQVDQVLANYSSTRQPLRVYVYDVPRAAEENNHIVYFRDSCYNPYRGCEETAIPPYSLNYMVNLFGLSFKIPQPGNRSNRLHVQAVSQYATSRIMTASLMRYPHRTYDPKEADLFYIPMFTENFTRWQSDCPSAAKILSELPYLNESTAARHFWPAPTVGWTNDTCEEWNAQYKDPTPSMRLLAKVQKLALEDKESAPQILGRDWNGDLRQPPVAENLHSIPYPSILSSLNDSEVEAWRNMILQTHRPLVATAAWGFHGLDSAMSDRDTLRQQCQSNPECLFEELDMDFFTENTNTVVSAMLQAKFCLEPAGDSPSRKGMIDALTSGCIPVLFNIYQTKCWPWHVQDWSEVSLQFDNVPPDIISVLEQIPEAEIQRMQQKIASMLENFIFSMPGYPRDGDALDITLRHLQKIAVTQEKITQQTEAGTGIAKTTVDGKQNIGKVNDHLTD